MGFKIAALALWGGLLLLVVPGLLRAEGTYFRSVPSPLARQVTRGAEGLLDVGLDLLGSPAVHRAGQTWR